MYVVFYIQIFYSCFFDVKLGVCMFFAIIWDCLYIVPFPSIDLRIYKYLAISLNLVCVSCWCYLKVLVLFKIVIGRCTCLDKSVSKTQILICFP